MKKTILLAFLALFITFLLPFLLLEKAETQPKDTAAPQESAAASPQIPAAEQSAAVPESLSALAPAPETISVLTGEQIVQMDMQEYLLGVLAAEMPASFEPEALKAQAVAARSYAMYCAMGDKHGQAQVCTDFACCQAWLDTQAMKDKWGGDFELYYEKIRSAVEETEGEYLSYEGQAVFAAFHSSSAGATEDCGRVWNPKPYLVSVESPETAEDVPNYISSLDCAALDFRDTILSACPEADFTGDESGWIGQIERDESGRVYSIVLGGVEIKGTQIRSLFSLRSTAFQLEYSQGRFIFTVTGYGHGVGMSQYGAQVMAEEGADYTEILAHYYPGTLLS